MYMCIYMYVSCFVIFQCGLAPIHCATVNNHQETVKLLLQNKACAVDQPTEYGETPFQIACLNGHTDLAMLVHCMVNMLVGGPIFSGTLYMCIWLGTVYVTPAIISEKLLL